MSVSAGNLDATTEQQPARTSCHLEPDGKYSRKSVAKCHQNKFHYRRHSHINDETNSFESHLLFHFGKDPRLPTT
jgi:hypothetical protein